GAVLPAVDAWAAYARLDGAAAAARAGGDPRSLDQLRSDLFTHLLTTPAAEPAAASAGGLPAAPVAPVSPASSRLAAVPDGHGCSVDGAAGGGTDAGIDPAGSTAPSTESMSPAVGSTGRSRGHALVEAGCPPPAPGGGARVQVQVVIALSSLVGLDSRGGDLPGYGTLPAGVVRDLAAADDVTLSRLLCDPDTGTVLQADPSAYVPSAAMRHAIGCRDRRCRMPVCGARIRHLDHIQARVDSGLTTTANLHGLCQRSHLAKHHPAWRVSGDADNTVTWTTPTGRIYTSTPPPATGHGTGPPRPYRRAASRSEADTVP
ncbi:MAG TPA: hypothetical protein VES21_05140, partial [Nocardioidaceae bacterium]|nr:hypothetical protein [Nocardioidaceae bacterium]